MKVIFFRHNINFVTEYLKTNKNSNTSAFWFSPGLTSYKYIADMINIESVLIEEGIFEEITKITNILDYKISTFPDKLIKDRETKTNKKICFFASNDTLMLTFKPILDNLSKTEYKVFCRGNENALSAAEKLGIPCTAIKNSIPNPEEYSLLVLGNDWGLLERKINVDFLYKKVNTVCIQESCMDFNSVDRRMQNAAFPIFQGVATLRNYNITNKITAVIGNSRFEGLAYTAPTNSNKVIINSNFTYGLHEDARYGWIRDVVDVCQELNLEYVISKHPRDNGDLSEYNVLESGPFLVHETIKESVVLISRFSALLIESICLGRRSIYYNPHGESMKYSFDEDNNNFFKAQNKQELKQAIYKTLQLNKNNDNNIDPTFLEKHLGNSVYRKASTFTAKCINDLRDFPEIKSVSLLSKIILRAKIIKRILLKQAY